jgi:hypothetical protein
MVTIHNGLIPCRKCNDGKMYTPVGLAKHWTEAHPVHVVVKVPITSFTDRLQDPCPMDLETCMNCWFNQSFRCRFGLFQIMQEKQERGDKS